MNFKIALQILIKTDRGGFNEKNIGEDGREIIVWRNCDKSKCMTCQSK